MIRVLWISRHDPTPEEIAYLESLLGEIELLRYRRTIRQTHYLGTLLDNRKPGRVVATLPIDMQEVLVNELKSRGLPPLIRPVYHHRNGAGVTNWEFKGYEEIIDAVITSRPLIKQEQEENGN